MTAVTKVWHVTFYWFE